ncbi:hypothetical protein POTOM_059145 [Populus tomentosa]|uniref:inositol-1,3,4-trisphosphate 5/6-kinase n=1 Tax=Populus tomentosa TaxID=118781 RepID=A0A8X8C1B1_POPTO|nr:hypothetical protein POTOM_059145 [Populus tomentosa]
MSQLLHFSSLNPDAPIIDPLDSIQRLHDRISMLQVNSDDLIKKSGFPLIAKPLMADGMVGDFVKCVKRKSLPDIKEDKLVTLKGLLLFLQISNLKEKTDCGGGGEFDRVEMPPVDFIEEVAKAMKEETGTSLLNFDMIRDARDAKRYLIIDINYFPGYEKIPNYESVLTDFILNSMEKNKSGDVSMVREHDDD